MHKIIFKITVTISLLINSAGQCYALRPMASGIKSSSAGEEAARPKRLIAKNEMIQRIKATYDFRDSDEMIAYIKEQTFMGLRVRGKGSTFIENLKEAARDHAFDGTLVAALIAKDSLINGELVEFSVGSSKVLDVENGESTELYYSITRFPDSKKIIIQCTLPLQGGDLFEIRTYEGALGNGFICDNIPRFNVSGLNRAARAQAIADFFAFSLLENKNTGEYVIDAGDINPNDIFFLSVRHDPHERMRVLLHDKRNTRIVLPTMQYYARNSSEYRSLAYVQDIMDLGDSVEAGLYAGSGICVRLHTDDADVIKAICGSGMSARDNYLALISQVLRRRQEASRDLPIGDIGVKREILIIMLNASDKHDMLNRRYQSSAWATPISKGETVIGLHRISNANAWQHGYIIRGHRQQKAASVRQCWIDLGKGVPHEIIHQIAGIMRPTEIFETPDRAVGPNLAVGELITALYNDEWVYDYDILNILNASWLYELTPTQAHTGHEMKYLILHNAKNLCKDPASLDRLRRFFMGIYSRRIPVLWSMMQLALDSDFHRLILSECDELAKRGVEFDIRSVSDHFSVASPLASIKAVDDTMDVMYKSIGLDASDREIIEGLLEGVEKKVSALRSYLEYSMGELSWEDKTTEKFILIFKDALEKLNVFPGKNKEDSIERCSDKLQGRLYHLFAAHMENFTFSSDEYIKIACGVVSDKLSGSVWDYAVHVSPYRDELKALEQAYIMALAYQGEISGIMNAERDMLTAKRKVYLRVKGAVTTGPGPLSMYDELFESNLHFVSRLPYRPDEIFELRQGLIEDMRRDIEAIAKTKPTDSHLEVIIDGQAKNDPGWIERLLELARMRLAKEEALLQQEKALSEMMQKTVGYDAPDGRRYPAMVYWFAQPETLKSIVKGSLIVKDGEPTYVTVAAGTVTELRADRSVQLAIDTEA